MLRNCILILSVLRFHHELPLALLISFSAIGHGNDERHAGDKFSSVVRSEIRAAKSAFTDMAFGSKNGNVSFAPTTLESSSKCFVFYAEGYFYCGGGTRHETDYDWTTEDTNFTSIKAAADCQRAGGHIASICSTPVLQSVMTYLKKESCIFAELDNSVNSSETKCDTKGRRCRTFLESSTAGDDSSCLSVCKLKSTPTDCEWLQHRCELRTLVSCKTESSVTTSSRSANDPSARFSACCACTAAPNYKLFVVHGRVVEEYDFTLGHWKRLPATKEVHAQLAIINGTVFSTRRVDHPSMLNDRGEMAQCGTMLQAYYPPTNTEIANLVDLELPEHDLSVGAIIAATNHSIFIAGGATCNGTSALQTAINVTWMMGEGYSHSLKTPLAMMSTGRMHFSLALLAQYVYAVGGWTGTLVLKSAERYDLARDSWSLIPDLNNARFKLCVAVANDTLYAIGGQSQDDEPLNTVEVYDEKARKWHLITRMSMPRVGAAAAVYEGAIYVVGGLLSGEVDYIEVYGQTSSWTRLALREASSLNPSKRELYGVALVSSNVELESSGSLERHCQTNTTEQLLLLKKDSINFFDFYNRLWIRRPAEGARQFTEVVSVNGSLYASEGDIDQDRAVQQHPEKCFQRVNLFDEHANAWRVIESVHGRKYGQLCSFLGNLYSVGGGNCDATKAMSTVEVLDTKINEWRKVASMGTPRACYAVAAVSRHMYAVGGTISLDGIREHVEAYQRSAERYSPLTNTWSPLAPMTASRLFPSLGVVGENLYVIGGENLRSVELFDQSTQLWRSVASMHTSKTSMSTATHNGLLYVAGFEPRPQCSDYFMEVYNPRTDSWTYVGRSMLAATSRFMCNFLTDYDIDLDIETTGFIRLSSGYVKPMQSTQLERKKLRFFVPEGSYELDFAARKWTSSLHPERSFQDYESIEIYPESVVNLRGNICAVANFHNNSVCMIQIKCYNASRQEWRNVGLPLDGLQFRGMSSVHNPRPSVDGVENIFLILNAVSCFSDDPMPENPLIFDVETNAFRRTSNFKTPEKTAVRILSQNAYVAGGASVDGLSYLSSRNTSKYSFAKDEWSSVAEMKEKREALCLAVASGRLYAIGGAIYGNDNCLNSVEGYDPASNLWSDLAPMSVGRCDAVSAAYNDLIYVVGGTRISLDEIKVTDFQINIVEIFNPERNIWTRSSIALPNIRYRQQSSLVVVNAAESQITLPVFSYTPVFPHSGGSVMLTCIGELPEGATVTADSCTLHELNFDKNMFEALLPTEITEVDEERATVAVKTILSDLEAREYMFRCTCFHGHDRNSANVTFTPSESAAPSTNGSDTYSFDVLPFDPPKRLNCGLRGVPVPTIDWFRDGEKINFHHNYSHCVPTPLDNAATLVEVSLVTRSCVFVCRARNFLGEASLNYTLNAINVTPVTLIASIAVTCAVVVVAALVALVFYWRLVESRKKTIKNVANKIAKASAKRLLTLDGITFSYQCLPEHVRDDVKILFRRIKEGHYISSGAFGVQFRATLDANGDGTRIIDVAVKSLKLETASVSQFLKEALQMRKFDHERVLPLLGISFYKHVPLIVTPFMSNGDLQKYLKDENHEVDQKQLLSFALQIADGMTYVHSKDVVHRDLACRNCLLDENIEIKICDFGLCRDVDSAGEYVTTRLDETVPVKNMAPESIRRSVYNTKTDVWSYGVVLWEIWSRADTPYSEINMQNELWVQELVDMLENGVRLDKPAYCPQMIYDVMHMCWSGDANKRPEFVDLCKLVHGMLDRCTNESPADDVETDYFLNSPVPVVPPVPLGNVAGYADASVQLSTEGTNGQNTWNDTDILLRTFP